MVSKSNQKFLKQYEDQLQKPKWKFVLSYGLAWSVVLMAITIPLNLLVFDKGNFSWGKIAGSFLIWLIGGLIYGMWLHWYITRKFKSMKQNL